MENLQVRQFVLSDFSKATTVSNSRFERVRNPDVQHFGGLLEKLLAQSPESNEIVEVRNVAKI